MTRGCVGCLVPPASADNACTRLFGPIFGPAVDGICALGEINLDTFEVIDPLERPRISGFVVKGFTGRGIFAVGTEDLRATHNRAKDNTGYGIFAILSTRPVLAYNKASGNSDAGLYVGSNQQVDAKVFGNTTWDNSIGIFLLDVSYGTAERNHVFGNCSGILLLAGAPGPLTNWKIRRNLVVANNKTDCGEEDPVPSGMGILLLGATDNDISRNLVLRNRGEGKRDSAAASCWSPAASPAARSSSRQATPSARTSPSATSRSTSPGTAPAAASCSRTTARHLPARRPVRLI